MPLDDCLDILFLELRAKAESELGLPTGPVPAAPDWCQFHDHFTGEPVGDFAEAQKAHRASLCDIEAVRDVDQLRYHLIEMGR